MKCLRGAGCLAADSFLLKYDADNYTLLDQAIVHGIRRFAIWNDEIICTQGEVGGLPHYCEVRDRNSLGLLYSIPATDLPNVETGGKAEAAYCLGITPQEARDVEEGYEDWFPATVRTRRGTALWRLGKRIAVRHAPRQGREIPFSA